MKRPDRWAALGVTFYATEDPPANASVRDLLLHGLRPACVEDPIEGMIVAIEEDVSTLLRLLIDDSHRYQDTPEFLTSRSLKGILRRLTAARRLLRLADKAAWASTDRWTALGLRRVEDTFVEELSIVDALMHGAGVADAKDPIEAILVRVQADLATLTLSLRTRDGPDDTCIEKTALGLAHRVEAALLLLRLADNPDREGGPQSGTTPVEPEAPSTQRSTRRP